MQRKLDLRTGRTIWQSYRAPPVHAEPLRRDIVTDVLIVGMGISGAMIADAVTAMGLKTVVIDRRGPMLGSTAATTALVQFEIDEPLGMLAKRIGKDRAMQAWRRSRLSLSNLAEHIESSGIACQTVRRPSLYLAGNRLSAGELRAEAEMRRAAGIGAEYLTRTALAERFGIDRPGAILSHGNLALDPRKLTAGLLLKAQARGARLHAKVEATGISDSKDSVTIATKDGPTIRAKHLVLATGYELMDGVDAPAHRIISTWAIATRPQRDALWPQQPHIWEASDPYLYLRSLPDGRVVAGGEDEDFTDTDRRDALIAEKSAHIAAKLKVLLPQLDTRPAFAWAGSFGTTTTGLPIIGQVPRKPRVFAVMGYGGNGITYSRIATELISTALDGGSDTDAGLFAF